MILCGIPFVYAQVKMFYVLYHLRKHLKVIFVLVILGAIKIPYITVPILFVLSREFLSLTSHIVNMHVCMCVCVCVSHTAGGGWV